jgi:hypothetical protein
MMKLKGNLPANLAITDEFNGLTESQAREKSSYFNRL